MHIVLGDAHVGVDHGARRQSVVLKRVQHALGIAGRARRERHAEDLVGAHAHALARGASGGAIERCPCIEAPRAPSARPPATTNGSSCGMAALQLTRHGDVVEALELARADEGAAAREAQDVVELAHAEIRVDLVGDGADQLQRKEDDREVDPVRQLDGDDVAALDADAAQEGGAALDLVLQPAVGDAAPGVGENLAVGMRRGPRAQDFEERLVGPFDRRPRQRLASSGLSTVSNCMRVSRPGRNSPFASFAPISPFAERL